MALRRRIGGGGESFDLAADHTFTGNVQIDSTTFGVKQQLSENTGDNNTPLILKSGKSSGEVAMHKSTGGEVFNCSTNNLRMMGANSNSIRADVESSTPGDPYFRPFVTDSVRLGGVDNEWYSIHGREIIAGEIQQLPSYSSRPTAAVAGRVIWNSVTGMPEFDTGSAWVKADGTGV